VCALILLSGGVLAQSGGIAREHHPWGRFQPGAWKLVRVTTETFEDGAAMTSLTETKTTLKAVDQEGVTLLIEVSVQVAKKRFETQPYLVKQNFFGELTDHKIQTSELDPAEVTIQGREIPCQVYQLEIRNTASQTVTKIYYSDKVEPFILRREIVKSDLETGQKLSETTVEVIATDVPCKVLGDNHNCSKVRWVQEHANGTSTTVADTSTDVPGGTVSHTMKELDAEGQMVRRSSLALVDFGYESDEKRYGLFRRKGSRRSRKSYRYTPY
jgi:hypothetical protein